MKSDYLHPAKNFPKKVHNNIINSISLLNRINTVFMNFENSKTSDPHRLLLNLSDKINLKRSEKYVALSNLSIYYTLKNIKKLNKDNKFKIATLTWNEEFELPDRSCSVSGIQDYFEYIFKKQGTIADNLQEFYLWKNRK